MELKKILGIILINFLLIIFSTLSYAQGTIGQTTLSPAIDNSGWNGLTDILLLKGDGSPAGATIAGKLLSISINSNIGNLRFKVFRDDGTNYNYIWGDTADRHVVVGVNTFDVSLLNIQVLVGDLIGVYFEFDNPRSLVGSLSNAECFHTGNVTSTTLKSSWTSSTGKRAIGGTITVSYGANALFFGM